MIPFYRDLSRLGGARAERIFATGLSLPCSTGLTDADQDKVIEAVLSLAGTGVR